MSYRALYSAFDSYSVTLVPPYELELRLEAFQSLMRASMRSLMSLS